MGLTVLQRLEEKHKLAHAFKNDFPWHFKSFRLSDFGLDENSLLEQTLSIEKQVGLQGWRARDLESKTYRGFSLCYNPKMGEDPFATLGDFRLSQVFSLTEGSGKIEDLENSYYDTYAFNKMHSVMAKEYAHLIQQIKVPLIRSRVSYIDPQGGDTTNYPFHRDEPVFQNLRINIPLQTSPEYILEIDGEDEYGNSLQKTEHLEVGKLYIWNTRIPHRVLSRTQPKSVKPRIHLVLGLAPWFDLKDGEYTVRFHRFDHPDFMTSDHPKGGGPKGRC